jgi:hypothetical protein
VLCAVLCWNGTTVTGRRRPPARPAAGRQQLPAAVAAVTPAAVAAVTAVAVTAKPCALRDARSRA